MPEIDDLLDLYWGGPERRITGLTLRIIGVNFAALLMLLLGVVYLGQYQSALIETKLQTLRVELQLSAVALSESTETPRMVSRLAQAMNQRIYVFDQHGNLMADSARLPTYESAPSLEDGEKNSFYTIKILKKMAHLLVKIFPARQTLPAYIEKDSMKAADYSDAATAINGSTSVTAWRAKDDGILLTAAAPLMKNNRSSGAVMLLAQGRDIREEISNVWLNILAVFLATLFVTIFLAIYLSNAIANPLRKLTKAAEAVRRGKSKDSEIPDLSYRKDEIGELSLVLREMTQALWERMDSIERFAADVAHELKNPLTSLRSAVETAAVVKKEKDREKLLAIIQHDVERMDRLISDISTASRLDAELSREALEPVNVKKIARDLLDIYQNPQNPIAHNVQLRAKENIDYAYAWGREGRLFQALENLVANAISFSPHAGLVTIEIAPSPSRKNISITVEDEGPGIPDNKLETIFERFYTERPEHEAFGGHSGLGLSICRQIVTAMGGRIFAENVRDSRGEILGARFTIILNAA